MTISAVSADTFEQEVLQSTEPVLVDFFADWCGPCKAMAPALEQVSNEMQGKLKVVKLDVENSRTVSAEYGVRSLPTLILFRNGKPAGRHVGALVQKDKLEEQINTLLAVASKSTPVERRATKFELANGMDVVVIPDHRAPAVTHMVFYRVGEADAPQGVSGISNLLERLMFKSIETVAVGEFSHVHAGRDATAYHQRIAKDQLQPLMEMEAHRMTSLRLTDDEVAIARKALDERRSRLDNNAMARLNEQLHAALFLSHPYGTPAIGRANEIANLSGADAKRFYERYYAPNNAILVVAGDVTPEEVKRLAEDTYGNVPANPEVGRRARPQAPLHVAAPPITVKDQRVRNAELHRAYCVPSYVTAKPGEAEALELLMQILRDRPTGRLYRKFVEGKLATGAGGSYVGTAADSGVITLYVVATGDLEAVEEGIDAVLDDVRANGVSELELERAKQALTPETRDDIYNSDNNEKLAQRYGTAVAIGRSIEDVEGSPTALAKVTADDIKQVANAYLDKSRSVTGWLLPEQVAAVA